MFLKYFISVLTEGMVDGLSLLNGELYYSLVKVTTALGYSYILRSDGVTIQQNALLPGRVLDGDMAGYDLNVLPSQSIVYGSWDGFGLPADTIAQIDILTGNSYLAKFYVSTFSHVTKSYKMLP